MWSDETKIRAFWPNLKFPMFQDTPSLYRGSGGGGIMLWGCFLSAGTGHLVGIDGRMNGAKYRDILLQPAKKKKKTKLWRKFTFQQDNATLDWLKNKKGKCPTKAQSKS